MRRRDFLKSARAAVVFAAFAVIALPPVAPAASTLSRLRGIQELRSWFNANKGRPRLVLLLSPT